MRSRLAFLGRPRALALAGLLVIGLAAGAGAIVGRTSRPVEPAALAPAVSTDRLARGHGVALGVNLTALDPAALADFYHQTGVVPRIVMWYQTWAQPLFYASELPTVRTVHAIPMITWDPTLNGRPLPLARIAAGRYDRYLRWSASAAARTRTRIYVRFAHEMNVTSNPWGPGHQGNTPGLFVRAWRHVVSVFRQRGASNVEWVWSPNADCNGKCPFTGFYPGNRWVAWTALDGYNYSSVDNTPWETFQQVFATSYRELVHLSGKPVMIGETSSAEAGGDKARWIAQIGPALQATFPRVRALVWFDRVKETDWRIDSSLASLKAFQQLVHTPPFTP